MTSFGYSGQPHDSQHFANCFVELQMANGNGYWHKLSTQVCQKSTQLYPCPALFYNLQGFEFF